MQLNFTVECTLDIPNQEFTARVNAVVDETGQDISRQFFDFCRQEELPLSTEEEIRTASYAFGKRFYAS